MRVTAILGTVVGAIFISVVPAVPAAGQSVRGHVTQGESDLPIAGALVALEGVGGADRLVGLTDVEGRFFLPAARAGAYRLRVDLIGAESVWSPLFALGDGETREFRIPLPPEPVDLRELVRDSPGSAADACAPAPLATADPVAAILWGEVRKALTAVAVAHQAELLRYAVREYERSVDGTDSQAVDRREPDEFVSTHPLAVVNERWVDEGFVRRSGGSVVYQAPVPEILLAPPFLQRHCFLAVAGGEERPGLVGLAFRPIEVVSPDVSGTFWVDEASAELRSLEYAFSGLPERFAERPRGGRIDFDRLPDGAWIARRWFLRIAQDATDSARVIERGGVVTAVEPAVDLDPGGEGPTIVGTVVDSIRGRPLEGATVFLWGTAYRTLSDDRGRFRFDRIPEGDYSASFFHPVLTEWDVIPATVPVSAVSGSVTTVALAVPSIVSLLSASCPSDTTGGVVVGTVRDIVTELPLPGARVVLDWIARGGGKKPGRLTDRSNAHGWFRFCGVPFDIPIVGRAQFHHEWTTGQIFYVEGGGSGPTVQHIDIEAGETVTLAGRLVDEESGSPVPQASVHLVGTERYGRSDSSGAFVFDSIPEGFYELAVVHPDYGSISDTVTVQGSGTVRIEMNLGTAPSEASSLTAVSSGSDSAFVLEDIIVEGKAVPRYMAGFYERRREGFGSFITRDEFERYRPRETTDLIRRLSGFTVMQAGRGLGSREYNVFNTRQSSRNNGLGQARQCQPIYFVDGAYLGNGEDVDIDQVMSVFAIEAVEAYPGIGHMPMEYNRQGANCGAIAFWTRAR